MIPIEIQILDEIGARLALIDEASGYFTTVKKIERGKLDPFDGYDLPALNYWSGLDSVVASGGGYDDCEFSVLIEYHDKTRDRPFTDVSAELAADVQNALFRATGAGTIADLPSFALGGLVTGIKVQTKEPEIGTGQKPFLGTLLNCTVTYKRKPSDPFTIIT